MADGIILSQKDANRLRDMLRWYEHTGKNILPQRRRNIPGGGGTNIKIFAVHSNATGDAVYNCYEQIIVNADWALTNGAAKTWDKEESPTAVEILNLAEHNPDAGQHNLVEGDVLAAWQVMDDKGIRRWVGVPAELGTGTETRRAKTQAAAGADTKISCKLLDSSGNEEGDAMDVYCNISGGGNLEDCFRLLASGDILSVFKDKDDKWHSCEGFQTWPFCEEE